MNKRFEKKKMLFLSSMLILYLLIGLILFLVVRMGVISKLTPDSKEFGAIEYDLGGDYKYLPDRLQAAEQFVDKNLRKENGHINLYYLVNGDYETGDNYTNSEAVSYYLLWNVKDYNKVAVDEEINFIEKNMIHPNGGYIMWKLNDKDKVVEDGANIATDADLRIIYALILAKGIWGDKKYSELIENLSSSLEEIAITQNNSFAPYGGFRDGNYWKTNEVWLSYGNFNAFSSLAKLKGNPWRKTYYKMQSEILNAQDEKGLYYTQLEEFGNYSSRLDNDKYSINTLWIMLHSAESNSPELRASASKALDFYKEKYNQDGMIFTDYNKDGSPASGGDSPWVYALVGRTAISLNDESFADSMIYELLKKQEINNDSDLYGGFVEGPKNNQKVGQFTMQESILTLQEYIRMKSESYKETKQNSG